jgi:hypothetical protein
VAIPPLPRPVASAEAQPPRPAGPFPTSEQLLAKYVQAVRGKAAAEKFNSIVLKGTNISENASMPLEVYRKSPGKVLSPVSTPQGAFSLGFDGTAGWMQGGNGVHDLGAAEMAFMMDQEGIYDVIKIQEPFPKMRLAGEEKIGDRDAWILRAPGPDNKILRLYFDAETGYLLRKVILTPSMIGAIPEQFDFEDYREGTEPGCLSPFACPAWISVTAGPAASRRSSTMLPSKTASSPSPPATKSGTITVREGNSWRPCRHGSTRIKAESDPGAGSARKAVPKTLAWNEPPRNSARTRSTLGHCSDLIPLLQ